MYGGIAQIAVGRYCLQIGDPRGAVIGEVARTGRALSRPRPTPVLRRPRSTSALVDRQVDLAAVLAALDAGLAVEVSGEPGIGKTAVLHHLAHHPSAGSFADGIVYLSARQQVPSDLRQILFEAFHETDEFYKPTEAEIRRGLQDTHALILLDDVHLAPDELEQVLDIAPRAAFVVATRERRLWGEARSFVLKGLPAEDAVSLFEREFERSLEATEQSAAAALCSAVGGNPLRIRQAAAVICDRGLALDGSTDDIAQDPVADLMASTDEKQRRVLLALAALPGVPQRPLHLAGIAQAPDIEASLAALVRRGLVVRGQSRYRLADGVGDRLRRTEDLKPWTNRAITYFTAWAERHQRAHDTLLQESEALLRVQQLAADARRSGEVLHLGRLLGGPLIVGARWGAWGAVLERCLDAARVIGDRSAEAWSLHELGSRAACLGETGKARAMLNQAVKLREMLNDDAAAAASRHNLRFVLPPIAEYAHVDAPAPEIAWDLESLPLRSDARVDIADPPSQGSTALVLAMLLFVFSGGLTYWTLTHVGSLAGTSVGKAAARFVTTPAPRRTAPEPDAMRPDESGAVGSGSGPMLATDVTIPAASPEGSPGDRARILIFTPRPGSFATGGPTSLCYAVSETLRVHLEPDIGEVAPSRTLTCLRVAPLRTTTYQLTASGRDGYQVRQQVVIVVR